MFSCFFKSDAKYRINFNLCKVFLFIVMVVLIAIGMVVVVGNLARLTKFLKLRKSAPRID